MKKMDRIRILQQTRVRLFEKTTNFDKESKQMKQARILMKSIITAKRIYQWYVLGCSVCLYPSQPNTVE